MVDTGASKGGSAAVNQIKAYCKYVGERTIVDSSKVVICHFGVDSAKSKGVASKKFPVGSLSPKLYAQIPDVDTPIFLSIDGKDQLGIYLSNPED